MKVIGISMVKDEQDVIEHVVYHMLAQVDKVIVADNLSDDKTLGLLMAIAKDQPRLRVLDDPDPAYYQSEKMTALAQTYAKPGDWVVPFDADELWGVPSGENLGDWLRNYDGDVAAGRPWTHVRRPGETYDMSCPFRDMPFHRTVQETWPKAALRWTNDTVIEQGNHWTTSAVPDVLDIHHFQYRSYAHYATKVEAGRRAMELTDLPYNSSEHWRRAAEMTETERHEWWHRYVNQPLVLGDPRCLACLV
jgi:hypothetical protein